MLGYICHRQRCLWRGKKDRLAKVGFFLYCVKVPTGTTPATPKKNHSPSLAIVSDFFLVVENFAEIAISGSTDIGVMFAEANFMTKRWRLPKSYVLPGVVNAHKLSGDCEKARHDMIFFFLRFGLTKIDHIPNQYHSPDVFGWWLCGADISTP